VSYTLLSAIKDIGEFTVERDNVNRLDIVIDRIDGSYYNQVIGIELEKKGDGFEFLNVRLEGFDGGKETRYLHKSGSSSGANFTPTSKISQNKVDKVEGMIDRRILGWFKILNDKKLSILDDNKNFLENMRDVLEENIDSIKEKVVELWEGLDSKEHAIVTLKIYDDGEYKYLGDYEVFKRLIFYQLESKSGEIKSENKICSICGNASPTVMGNVSPYAFYTIDKIGYITGGFQEEKSWRNFPICPDCVLKLEHGRKYIEQNLSYNFCGIGYYLVPKFLVGTPYDHEYIFEIWEDGSKNISLGQEAVKSITGDEDDILYELQDAGDTMALDFLFLRRDQSAERILLHIQDVFPSRIRIIFDAKNYVDSIMESNFTFRTIRKFFFKSDAQKTNTDLDKYFLDIIDRIFKSRPISSNLTYKFIVNMIRNDLLNQKNYYFSVQDGLMTILFLSRLGLIEMEEGKIVEDRIFEEMFKKYGDTFKTPVKKGLFLLGSLTELLLRTQKKNRGTDNPPFLKNLKSFRLNERDFRGLMPKVQNKLEEYNSFRMRERVIAQEASHYMLLAGDGWDMTVDEMNFYFCTGMHLAYEVTSVIFQDNEKKRLNNEEVL
jgi:CRISPR-associated protein Csh1